MHLPVNADGMMNGLLGVIYLVDKYRRKPEEQEVEHVHET
jgi:hypothetical protein